MKQKINLRLGLLAFVAMALTVTATSLVFYDLFRQQVARDLRRTAHLLSESREFKTLGNLPTFHSPDVRVTWVDGQGKVLYDDEADAESLPNHLDRPEIQAALETGEGESIRNSDTLNLNTFYYALGLDNGTVLRLSVDARSFGSVVLAAVPVLVLEAAVI